MNRSLEGTELRLPFSDVDFGGPYIGLLGIGIELTGQSAETWNTLVCYEDFYAG